jgi:hypothetical protein
MRIPQITPKLAGWMAALVAVAIAVGIALFTTDFGAGILARARCAGVWITSDAISYRACADFEREQILEQRRHTPED